MSRPEAAGESDPTAPVSAPAPAPTSQGSDSGCVCGDAIDRALLQMVQHCAEEIRKDPTEWLRKVRRRLKAIAPHNPPGRPRQERITKAAAEFIRNGRRWTRKVYLLGVRDYPTVERDPYRRIAEEHRCRRAVKARLKTDLKKAARNADRRFLTPTN